MNISENKLLFFSISSIFLYAAISVVIIIFYNYLYIKTLGDTPNTDHTPRAAPENRPDEPIKVFPNNDAAVSAVNSVRSFYDQTEPFKFFNAEDSKSSITVIRPLLGILEEPPVEHKPLELVAQPVVNLLANHNLPVRYGSIDNIFCRSGFDAQLYVPLELTPQIMNFLSYDAYFDYLTAEGYDLLDEFTVLRGGKYFTVNVAVSGNCDIEEILSAFKRGHDSLLTLFGSTTYHFCVLYYDWNDPEPVPQIKERKDSMIPVESPFGVGESTGFIFTNIPSNTLLLEPSTLSCEAEFVQYADRLKMSWFKSEKFLVNDQQTKFILTSRTDNSKVNMFQIAKDYGNGVPTVSGVGNYLLLVIEE